MFDDFNTPNIEANIDPESFIQSILQLAQQQHTHDDGSKVILEIKEAPQWLAQDDSDLALSTDTELDVPAQYGLPDARQRKILVWCTCGQEFDPNPTGYAEDFSDPNMYGVETSTNY